MIKAVIFDWGGVLIDNPSPVLIAYCAQYLKITEKVFLQTYLRFEPDFQKGILSEEAVWDNLCEALGIQKPTQPSLWEAAFRHAYVERKEMFSLVSHLKKNGYKTCFLSNTECPAMQIFLEKHYTVFDVIVFSCMEGTRKPEEKIYQLALKRLHVRPGEAVYIDDKQEYLRGAERIGIHVLLFTSYPQLRKDLSLFSIPIDS